MQTIKFRGKRLDTDAKAYTPGRTCGVAECERKHSGHGYCKLHYSRVQAHGNTDSSVERHGMTSTVEYRIWHGMRDRCLNPKGKDWGNYGGRGITICDRWSSFSAFYEDMGTRPGRAYSIDRIDTNGNYEPENCRWADINTQNYNRRTPKNNTSGRRGVNWDGKWKRWRAQINYGGVQRLLGSFRTREEAIAARENAELQVIGSVHTNPELMEGKTDASS